MTETRKDQSAISLLIDGEDSGALWEEKSGGGVGSDRTTIYRGGRKGPKELGGKQVYGQVTLVTTVDLSIHAPKIKGWQKKAGIARCSVQDQALDANDVPFGAPFVSNGRLEEVKEPERSSSDSEAAKVTVVIDIDEIG
jgi:hypothetical protein